MVDVRTSLCTGKGKV